MQVVIGGRQYSYTSDYSPVNNHWKIQAGAAFTFPVKIGPKVCFVKRFTSPPPGLGLLLILKAIQISPLPIVYDVVETNEHGQSVIYLFLELIKGDTLDDVIAKRQSFHSRKLTNGLLDCLQLIHKNGYWFSDLCEKNIFFDQSTSRYTLIDLDSCEPIKNHPSPTPNTPGYIPGQEFAAAVVNFYIEVLKVQKFTFSTLTGQQLNLLQLVPLVAKLELFVQAVNAQPAFIYRASNFPKLQKYIVGKKPAYSQVVFTKVLQNQFTAEMISTLCGFFASSYGTAFEPQIISFKVKPTQVEVGDSVTFSWETSNAENVEIKSSDGSFWQKNLPTSGICTCVVTKGQRFRLVADKVSQILDVRLVSPPRIKSFSSPKSQIYVGEKVALHWEVEGKPKQISLAEYTESGQIVWSDKSISTKGTKAVSPSKGSQVYTLNIGTSKQEIRITATLKPIIEYLRASYSQIIGNQSVELSWKALNVQYVTLYEQPKGEARKRVGMFGPVQQSLQITTSNTTTYILDAIGIREEITITVLQPQISYFNTTSAKISLGESITLSWELQNTKNGQLVEADSTGCDRVILSDLSKSGNLQVTPDHDTYYKLNAGQDLKILNITVVQPWTLLSCIKRYRQLITYIFLGLILVTSITYKKLYTSINTPKETEKITVDTSNISHSDTSVIIKTKPSPSSSGPNNAPAVEDEAPVQVETSTPPPISQVKPNEEKPQVPSQPTLPSEPTKPFIQPAPTNTEALPQPIFEEKDAGEGMKWRKENGLWALFDENGNRVTEAKYSRRGIFKNGKATIYDGPNPIIIDKKGIKQLN